jgi:hypothetical protein
MDCEDTFVALHQAQNLRLLHSGVRLLEDRATGSNPAAHPYFSSSAPNIASLVFESLEWMGARELETKQFVTLIIFGLGLLYAYRAVSLNTGSEVLGAIFIVLLATTDVQVLGFGQNALRAWHFLVFFGLLFHAGRVAQNPAKPLRRDYVAVTALLFIALGIGYDFQAICFFSAAFLFWLNSRNLAQRRSLKFIGFLFSAFLSPIILWQIYVAAVTGVDSWRREAFDGVSRVVSFLNISTAQLLAQTVREVSIPTMGAVSWLLFALVGSWAMWRTTQEFLSAHFTAQIKGLVNSALAGAGIVIGAKLFGDAVGLQAPIYIRVVAFLAVAAAVLVWWWLFRYAVAAAVTEASAWKIGGLPGIRWGLLLIVPVFLLFAMTVSAQRNAVTPEGSPFWPRVRWLYLASLGLTVTTGAIALMPKLQRVIILAGRIHTWFSALATRVKSARATGAFLNPRARSTLCSMILGIGAACIIFGPVAVSRYFQLQFPLVIFPVLLVKSLAILWLLAQASAYYRPARPVALATALLLAALLADHAVVQWTNFRQEPSMDLSWLEFVRSHPASTYAVSWTPQAVAAFTTGWTIGIQPGRESRIADRIHRGEAPFASDDLFQFSQRDAPDGPGRYLRPDYWIYFRTDNVHTAVLTIGNDAKEQAIPDREPEPQPSAASLASALGQLPRAADGASYVILDLRPLYHGNHP